MKSSHTPGPYSVSGIAGDNNIMARIGHERKTVCTVTGWNGITPEEFEANRRLFQSAPELLEACNGILELAKYVNGAFNPDIIKICNTAISKAEGNA